MFRIVNKEDSMKVCPKCGGKQFIVSAHVVEDWLVDENGNWIETICSGNEVSHRPDDGDLWVCSWCQYSANGRDFEAKSFNVTISYTVNETVTVAAHDADGAVSMASERIGCEDPVSYVVEDEDGNIVLDGMF